MILDCRGIQEKGLVVFKKTVFEKIALGVKEFPKLAVLCLGNDNASKIYMNNKVVAGEKCKVDVEVINLEQASKLYSYMLPTYVSNSTDTIEDEVRKYCKIIGVISNNFDGVILQLPLPERFTNNHVRKMINSIPKSKDVDGLTDDSIRDLHTGKTCYLNIPCTPLGIMTIFNHYKIELEGKHVLIINRSNLVGAPLSKLMLNSNATVSIAHSKTPKKKLNHLMREADVIITAVGKANFINKEDLIELNGLGAIEEREITIIDVSMNRNEEDKLCGDVVKLEDYSEFKNLNITPVPNGVGRTTVLALMMNVVNSWILNKADK